MNSVRFEKLLEQFMFGEMNIKEYRNERAKLVQEIVFDPNIKTSTEVDVNLSNNQTQIKNTKSTFEVPTINSQPSGLSDTTWKILIIIILLVTGITSWYYSEPENDKNNINAKVSSESNKVGSEKTIIKDEPFILAFNQNESWDTESISNFLVQWQSLSRTQQSLARQSDSFSELKQLLQDKIQQQRKATKENNTPATRKENLLIWFASQLSIGIK